MGTFQRHNYFLCCIQTVYSITALTLPLNLPITENFLHFHKTSLSVIYKFPHGTKKCPHKVKDFGYCHLFGDILFP